MPEKDEKVGVMYIGIHNSIVNKFGVFNRNAAVAVDEKVASVLLKSKKEFKKCPVPPPAQAEPKEKKVPKEDK